MSKLQLARKIVFAVHVHTFIQPDRIFLPEIDSPNHNYMYRNLCAKNRRIRFFFLFSLSLCTQFLKAEHPFIGISCFGACSLVVRFFSVFASLRFSRQPYAIFLSFFLLCVYGYLIIPRLIAVHICLVRKSIKMV